METPIKVTGCSMGCAYAEGPLSKCLCVCRGEKHGLMVPKVVFTHCSKNMGNRCKAGDEEGECKCACGGMNHGLYAHIPDFDQVRIIGLTDVN